MYAVTQLHHAFDAQGGCCVQLRLHHTAVLTVVHIAVNNGIAVIANIRVCWNRGIDYFTFAQLRQLRFGIGSANLLYCLMELFGKNRALSGRDREVLMPILSALRGLIAEYHFRVLGEVAVD